MTTPLQVNGITYRQGYRKCSKPTCKCASGQGHGPYWYAYQHGRAGKYIGAELPAAITAHIALLKDSKPMLAKLKATLTKRRDDAYRTWRIADQDISEIRRLEMGEYTSAATLAKLGLATLAPRRSAAQRGEFSPSKVAASR